MSEHPSGPSGDIPLVAVQLGGRKVKRARQGCLLSPGERRAIMPFKERYKAEVIKERRIALAKSEILTAYFNYLHSQQQAPRTPEELKSKTTVSLRSAK